MDEMQFTSSSADFSYISSEKNPSVEAMRSLKSVICGELYIPHLKPFLFIMFAIMQETEPFPFEPAT